MRSDQIETLIDPFHGHANRAAADAIRFSAVAQAVSHSEADSAAQDGIDSASQDGTGSAVQHGTDCSAGPGDIDSGSLNETAHLTIA